MINYKKLNNAKMKIIKIENNIATIKTTNEKNEIVICKIYCKKIKE